MDFDLHWYEKQLRKKRRLWRRIGLNLAFAAGVLSLVFYFSFPILWPAFTQAYYAQ